MFRLSFVILAVFLLGCKGSKEVQEVGPSPDVTVQPIFSTPFDHNIIMQSVKYLSSDALQGREANTTGGALAREHIIDRFSVMDLKPAVDNYLQPFTRESRRGNTVSGINVIGIIPGTSDKTIVVTAHYDHVGQHDGKIFNGADDNASGVGGLLAITEYFKKNKPKHNIVIAALDAEEKGLVGAFHLADNFPGGINQVVLNVNMDMISRSVNDSDELWACGTHHNPDLAPLLTNLDSPLNLMLGHDVPGSGSNDWTNASDHAAFHQKDIPFIYFGVEDHEDYHKPTDTFEKIDEAFYVNAMTTIIGFIEAFDSGAN